MHKRSFRHQFSRAADILDDEVSKFMSLQKIDPHIGELHAGEQFKLIGRFYPERMKTIHDLHVFRDQWLSRRPD
ncbi:hypothetical protein FGIG_08541 [Fasciola gigantica]|uniref:Uncharacterized protein n=1 Tax=Fasciola gigantica TaxID=46835 RepID=A0A504ZB06_FASGI|nr:hypothetical protein FGIG_08541 [Fasciola gigantica]